jgi:hypothetical protein
MPERSVYVNVMKQPLHAPVKMLYRCCKNILQVLGDVKFFRVNSALLSYCVHNSFILL